MQLNFRAMAALCSVAVSLSSGCESVPSDGASGGVSPLFSGENNGESLVEPYTPTYDDHTPAELADCTIELSEDSVKIAGDGAQINGSTISIISGGVYRLSGSGEQQIVIDCDDDVSLILDSAELSSPIESKSTADLKLTLAENSSNSLIINDGDAGIISRGDITVNGSGYLAVKAENGIRSEDDVMLCGGRIDLITESDGINCGGYILCAGTELDIHSGTNGLNTSTGYISMTDGILNITSDSNGIYSAQAVFISGGDLKLNCGGGSSAVLFMESGGIYPYGRHGGFFTDGTKEYDFSELISGDNTSPVSKKGIACGGTVRINGGKLTINSADDGIAARGNVLLNGGTLTVSSGDDAVHSDGSIKVTDGQVDILGSYTALEALAVEIDGGTLKLTSYRDGIKTAGGNDMSFYSSESNTSEHYVSISGGTTVIDAGGDGIDTGGTAAMSGGSVTIFSAADKRFGSLDYDDSFALSGGTLAAFGSDGLTKAPSMVSGVCLSVKAEIPADTEVRIENSNGDILFSTVLPKACSTVVFSGEELKSGSTYRFCAGEMQITSVTAVQGVCGDGPSGRGGTFNDISGNSSTSSGVVA